VTRSSNRQLFDNARRVTDEDDEPDGRSVRRRDPRSGQITDGKEQREVKLPRIGFLERRFFWEPKQ
jgi:hypothetical protein